MTVHKVLADIVDALSRNRQEHEAMRAEMVTKQDLAAESAAIRADMATESAAIRGDMATESAAMRADMATESAAIRVDMAAESAAIRADTAAESAAIRADMATNLAALEAAMKSGLGAVDTRLRKLGLEFEAFRHETKITLDMLSELMARTGRHESNITLLNHRVGRVEHHLKLKPLPNPGDQ